MEPPTKTARPRWRARPDWQGQTTVPPTQTARAPRAWQRRQRRALATPTWTAAAARRARPCQQGRTGAPPTLATLARWRGCTRPPPEPPTWTARARRRARLDQQGQPTVPPTRTARAPRAWQRRQRRTLAPPSWTAPAVWRDRQGRIRTPPARTALAPWRVCKWCRQRRSPSPDSDSRGTLEDPPGPAGTDQAAAEYGVGRPGRRHG
mmetsp:Transcript_14035/g.37302  ORF Transcript_14035/g.37302 Transcript_14035/m.37302 type:complete len:207 (+) Transcript_14035:227-847(+)